MTEGNEAQARLSLARACEQAQYYKDRTADLEAELTYVRERWRLSRERGAERAQLVADLTTALEDCYALLSKIEGEVEGELRSDLRAELRAELEAIKQ